MWGGSPHEVEFARILIGIKKNIPHSNITPVKLRGAHKIWTGYTTAWDRLHDPRRVKWPSV